MGKTYILCYTYLIHSFNLIINNDLTEKTGLVYPLTFRKRYLPKVCFS